MTLYLNPAIKRYGYSLELRFLTCTELTYNEIEVATTLFMDEYREVVPFFEFCYSDQGGHHEETSWFVGCIGFDYVDVLGLGFGFDEVSNDYKVCALTNSRKQLVVKVYSLKTNSWKTVRKISSVYDFEKIDRSGKLLAGKLHWGMHNKYFIISFDLSSNIFGNVEHRSYEEEKFNPCHTLDVVKECLCDLTFCKGDNWSEIWILKEYGVESWYKAFRFHHDQKIQDYPWCKPLCVTKDLEILYSDEEEKTFIFYDPTTNSIRLPKRTNSFINKGEIRIQSLVSPFPFDSCQGTKSFNAAIKSQKASQGNSTHSQSFVGESSRRSGLNPNAPPFYP